MSDAVSGIQSYWSDHYKAATNNCSRLALGERHPDIVRALADLDKYTAEVKGTVTQLKKDYNDWLRDVRKLREFSTKDRDELRDAMCNRDYDVEDKVKEIADRWASQISSAYGTVLGQGDRLNTRAIDDKIKKYKGSQAVVKGLADNEASLEKLKNGELQGSNNPKLRARMDYGKKMHQDMQSGSLCSSGYVEVDISSSYCSNSIRPGSGCRADCVVPDGDTCVVIEIKPDSKEAIANGDKQGAAYSAGLSAWYAGNKDELFKSYPKLKACEHDERSFAVTYKVEPYPFCPSVEDEKQLGDDIQDATPDLSDGD
jgi:hypothetical protein